MTSARAVTARIYSFYFFVHLAGLRVDQMRLGARHLDVSEVVILRIRISRPSLDIVACGAAVEGRAPFNRNATSGGRRWLTWVIELVAGDHQLRTAIDALLSIHEYVCRQQTKFDEEVRRLAKSDETTCRLVTGPGVLVGLPSQFDAGCP